MRTSLILTIAALSVSTTAHAGGMSTSQAAPVAMVAAEPTNDWSGVYAGAIIAKNTT